MKVCTDACLLGAWACAKIKEHNFLPENILDIGAGTGLLSLMLAQHTDAKIDAVEFNAEAAGQAKENVLHSPWNMRITVLNTAIQEFTANKKYDLIISNPPFFENDLLSGDENKNESKHSAGLKLGELAFHIKQNIAGNGLAFILIPFHRLAYFEKVSAANQLYLSEKLLIRQSTEHDFFRCLVLLSTLKADFVKTTTLSIYNDKKNYTEEFISLLQPFYLNL